MKTFEGYYRRAGLIIGSIEGVWVVQEGDLEKRKDLGRGYTGGVWVKGGEGSEDCKAWVRNREANRQIQDVVGSGSWQVFICTAADP